jgi:quercetin dioxygenase-like cupin family protein
MQTWDVSSLDIEPHHPQVLTSEDETRVIAIQLPKGEEMQEHQTYERSFMQVVDGEIEVIHADGTQAGGPGFLAHFEPNERRHVRATADARLLLVLAPWPGEGHPSRRA